jgi:hypothetical protein
MTSGRLYGRWGVMSRRQNRREEKEKGVGKEEEL